MASYARFVARRTRDLPVDRAAYVDDRIAEPADGRIPRTRFEDLLTGLIVASDPEAAARREQDNAERQVANPTRSTQDGMRGFFIRAPFAIIAVLDARVQWFADILAGLGDTDDLDARRVKAIAVLSNPHQAPVTESWLRQHLGPHARFTIRPVLDLAGQAPVDAYEIPDRHRQAVHLMTPADTFPWGVSSTRTQQIDHTEAFVHRGPPGQSRVGNYGPMTPFHHRIKTHAQWQVRQPFPGVYVWRDPHGAMYVVDHSGTRRVPVGGGLSPAEAHLSRALFESAA